MAKIDEIVYIADGVYASYDGFGLDIRVNHHMNPTAVYLEPQTLNALVAFYQRCQPAMDDNF